MTRAPIHRRPLDLVLVAFFSISVLYGFLFSLPEGIGVPVAPDSPWPPLRSLHEWAIAEEPARERCSLLDPPPLGTTGSTQRALSGEQAECGSDAS